MFHTGHDVEPGGRITAHFGINLDSVMPIGLDNGIHGTREVELRVCRSEEVYVRGHAAQKPVNLDRVATGQPPRL